MANLDEKLLDGPSVGYCSSSDGEEDTRTEENPLNDQMEHQSTGRTPKTGPKGVLADYERHRRGKRVENAEHEKGIMEVANRFSLETPANKQPQSTEEDELDELEQIRRRRLEQLKSMSKGRILEVPDRFEFLKLIEEQPSNCLLFMHIYADGNEHSDRLNEALLELAGRITNGGNGMGTAVMAKFYKVQTKVLGTTAKFTKDALPALQIYQREQLIGNFIRLTSELGDDYDGHDLLRFLRRNGILLADTLATHE